jgi:hypothetical protein
MYEPVASLKRTGDERSHAATHPSTNEANVDSDDDSTSSCQLGHTIAK